MNYNKEFLDNLREQVSIVDLVSKHLHLTRKGANYWGCCPFHNEKTASFSVVDDKKFYHCFGCGAHGDIISFTMEYHHLSFIDAVEKICNDYGIEIPVATEAQRKKDKLSHELYSVFKLATEFYTKELYDKNDTRGLDYLKSRQLSDEIISNFHLCYAGSGWDNLTKFLLAKQVPMNVILQSGLARISQKTNKPYDYFRERVLFPITDSRGRIIAFGGRIIVKDDKLPKYLNSPESQIFFKGKNLYGLAQSRINAIENNTLIATEGYMDTIALHKFGINYAVAPLGTAITESQIELMWKLVVDPVLCFDSDGAGRQAGVRAALRVLPILKPGYSIKFCLLEGAKDPDEFLHKYGKEKFETMLKTKCLTLVDLLWLYFTSGKIIETPEQKSGLEVEILNELSRIKSESVRKFYEDEFKDRIKKQYNNLSVKKSLELPKVDPENSNEKMILAFAITFPSLFLKFLENGKKITLTNNRYKKIFDIVISEISANFHTHETLIKYLHSLGYKPEIMLSFEMKSLIDNRENAKNILNEKIMQIDLEKLKLDLQKLNQQILQEKEKEKIESLRQKIIYVQSEINKIQENLQGE